MATSPFIDLCKSKVFLAVHPEFLPGVITGFHLNQSINLHVSFFLDFIKVTHLRGQESISFLFKCI